MSDRQLSQELGYSASYLSTLASSKNAPLIETIANVCDYFEVTLSDFFQTDFKGNKSAAYLYAYLDDIMEPEDVNSLLAIVKTLDNQKLKMLIEIFEQYAKEQ